MDNFSKGIIVSDVDSIIKYINEIKKIPLLTKEDEYMLFLRIKSGDKNAVNELVKSNLRFVIQIAKKYQNLGLSFEDLISFGNIGLYEAAEKFDGERGFKFVTFAIWYVKSEITKSLNELAKTVKIPNSQNSEDYNCISIDDGENRFIISKNVNGFDKSDLIMELKMILNSLSKIEFDAITRFYGFGYEYAQSIDQIAEHLGVKNERARQIIRKSEENLKNHPNLDILRKYLS